MEKIETKFDQDLFTCILCLGEFKNSLKSKEHIFPETLGGNILIYNMCEKCNNHLGRRVDAPLINSFFCKMKRRRLGLKERSGSLPEWMENLESADDPNTKIHSRNSKDGKSNFYVVPRLEITEKSDGSFKLFAEIDMSDELKFPKMLKKTQDRYLKKGKIIDLSNIKILEKKKISRMKLTFDLNLAQITRGLLKIAYEITCLEHGEIYLKDPIGKSIRELLLTDSINFDAFKNSGIVIEGPLTSLREKFPILDDEFNHYVTINYTEKTDCSVGIFGNYSITVKISDSNLGKSFSDSFSYIINVKEKSKERIKIEPLIEKIYQESILRSSSLAEKESNHE